MNKSRRPNKPHAQYRHMLLAPPPLVKTHTEASSLLLSLVGLHLFPQIVVWLRTREAIRLGRVSKGLLKGLLECIRTSRAKCTLSEGELVMDIGDIFEAVIQRPVTIYWDDPFARASVQFVTCWPYFVYSARHCLQRTDEPMKPKEEKVGVVVRGNFQGEGGLPVMLHIRPELGKLVEAGAYEVYALQTKATAPVATGTYKSLVELFKSFRKHLDAETDAKEAEKDRQLYVELEKREWEQEEHGFFWESDEEWGIMMAHNGEEAAADE